MDTLLESEEYETYSFKRITSKTALHTLLVSFDTVTSIQSGYLTLTSETSTREDDDDPR